MDPDGKELTEPSPVAPLPKFSNPRFVLADQTEQGLLTWQDGLGARGQRLRIGCLLGDDLFANGFE